MSPLYDIPNYPGYQITKTGKIWSLSKKGYHRGIFLSRTLDSNGYLHISLYKKGKQYTELVHRLVLEVFIGPCPEGMECCHKDGNKTNNHLKNLRWDTHSSNILDNVNSLTHNFKGGEKHYRAKLIAVEVKVIRQLLAQGELKQKEIAKLFNVTPATISDISRRHSWKFV